jgi:nitrate reductase cytochrome c-type subunit
VVSSLGHGVAVSTATASKSSVTHFGDKDNAPTDRISGEGMTTGKG